jgi:hypothetical protein
MPLSADTKREISKVLEKIEKNRKGVIQIPNLSLHHN